MNNLSFTFTKYLSKNFTRWLCTVTLTLSVIVSLFNVVELLRRSQNKPDVGIKQVLIMTLYQLPELLNQLMPFIILFSTMLLLWQMNRRSELVVARSLGMSIWSILTPVWITIGAFSILNYAVFNPISAEFSSRFEQMEQDLLTKRSNLLTISKTGLWLKQEEEKSYSLVRVERIGASKKDLENVTVYSFDSKNAFINRIEARKAKIIPEGWFFKDAFLSEADKPSQSIGETLWKTDLTIHKLQESFVSPDSLPIWKLLAFSELMEEAGLSSIEHLQHFYKLLFMPLVFLTMAAIAGICAYHFNRRQGGLHFVATGIGVGFANFFLHKISHAMGLSLTLPLLVSVLMPITIGVFASIAWLLHLEES